MIIYFCMDKMHRPNFKYDNNKGIYFAEKQALEYIYC